MLRRVRCLSSLISDYASYQSLLGNFKNILAPAYITLCSWIIVEVQILELTK